MAVSTYFDQSILGPLLEPNAPTSTMIRECLEGLFSQSEGRVRWVITPAGLIEGLWLRRPKLRIAGLSLPPDPVAKALAIFEWARSQYKEQLTCDYLERQINTRIEATKELPRWCQIMAQEMFVTDDLQFFQDKISSALAWSFVNQYECNNVEFDQAVGHICLEFLRLGRSIDFFRLGDRVYWNAKRKRHKMGKLKRAITKIEDNKDLLDAELCQLLVIGDCSGNSDNRIQVITRDFAKFPLRLPRCMVFFDTILSTGKHKFNVSVPVLDDPFGTLVTVRRAGNKMVTETVDIRNYLTETAELYPFSPKYFRLGYRIPGHAKKH